MESVGQGDESVNQEISAGRDAYAAVNQTIHIHPAPSRADLPLRSSDRLRAYLSSTTQDLRECRSQIRIALQRLGVEDAAALTDTDTAEAQRPVDERLVDVRSCDVYIGVFAWRYGVIPDGFTKSITELEYEEAVAAGIPRLLFLQDDQVPWPLALVDRRESFERIDALRARIQESEVCDLFANAEDLRSKVTEALVREMQRRDRVNADAPIGALAVVAASDWGRYKHRLMENYRRLDLDALTPPERDDQLQVIFFAFVHMLCL